MNLKTSAALIVGTLALPLAVMAQNIAVVNGKPVPKSRVDVLLKQATRSSQQPMTPELQAQARDQVVMREIFAQEAERQGVQSTAEYKAQMELVRQTVMIQALFQNYGEKLKISDEEAKAEYEKVKAEQSGQEYHARHILVETEDEAKKLIAQIKAGGKFEEIAKKSSKDTGSAENGGDLDWAKPSTTYVPEFANALTKLKPGEMTETPVKTQFGYHIIKLEDVRTAQFPAFDDVKEKLKEHMKQIKVQQYQEKLRKAAKTDYKFAAEEAANVARQVPANAAPPTQPPAPVPAPAPAPTSTK